MRILDRLMVCLYLLVAATPFVAMKLKVKDARVAGSLTPTPHPKLSWDGLRSEEYQKAYTAWFESRLGLKGYSVKTDNAILLRVFGETRSGSLVKVGEDGVLFKDEDLWFYNKDGALLPSQAHVDALADKLLGLQRRLQNTKQALVPMIIPSKTSIYRDKVPSSWTRSIGQPRPCDVAIYAAFKKALDARKVVYVDARERFTSGKYDRTTLWGAEARHWSSYGACLAMGDALRAYTALTGKPVTSDPCAVRTRRQSSTHVDYDLWGLLNAWLKPPRTREIPTVDYASPPAAHTKLSTLVVGTSFCWTLVGTADESKLFDEIYMAYYNHTLIDWPANVHNKFEPHSPAWNDKVLGRDLYVLDLFEVYLLSPGTYVDEFLGQLERALTAPSDAGHSGPR